MIPIGIALLKHLTLEAKVLVHLFLYVMSASYHALSHPDDPHITGGSADRWRPFVACALVAGESSSRDSSGNGGGSHGRSLSDCELLGSRVRRASQRYGARGALSALLQ